MARRRGSPVKARRVWTVDCVICNVSALDGEEYYDVHSVGQAVSQHLEDHRLDGSLGRWLDGGADGECDYLSEGRPEYR